MNYQLCQGDNLLWLHQLRDEPIAMIFADPPDNIGLNYGKYVDTMPDEEYIEYLEEWTNLFCVKAATTWISFNSKWLVPMAAIAGSLVARGWQFKPCVQTFTFYQQNKHDLGNAHRPLWRFRKPQSCVYPEQAKIPSWRQLNGDKRAAEGGKVPGDHFDFPRVVGNSKQRRSYHPTQLHEGLVERCIRLSTKPGDWVVDPFAGTGTTLRACKTVGDRDCTLIELDPGYCEKIAAEHNLTHREVGKFSRWETQ
jgi:DNA modification methylase